MFHHDGVQTSYQLPIRLAFAALLYNTSQCCCARQVPTFTETRILPPSHNKTFFAAGTLGRSRSFMKRQKNIEDVLVYHNPDNEAANERLRGGGDISKRQMNTSPDLPQNKRSINIVKITSISIALSLTVLISILNWETLILSLSTFFDREKFRTHIIESLNAISAKGAKGLFLYISGFLVWETCGLPTSVVETAAAMAFGFKNGLICSFLGKTIGSVCAFTLGRSLCQSLVKERLGDNEVLKLLERSVAKHPIRSAMIMRYSPFPQLIKNFGLSMTEPVTLPIFLLAIVVHGFPFSVLWAALGRDSSLRLRANEMGTKLDVNWALNGALLFVTVFGFVVSPLITGWWLTSMKNDNHHDKTK